MKKNQQTKKGSFSNSTSKRIYNFIDRVSFLHILLIWLGIVISFGFIYKFFSGTTSFLQLNQTQSVVHNLLDSIYFSFVSATTTGFGDITPLGSFRVLSTLEVVISLLIVAIVTSKLISLKQNVILDELYEITFLERINRMRSALLLFRQDIHNLIHKVEDGLVKKRDIQSLYQQLGTFKENINEITAALFHQNKYFTKQLDEMNAKLIANSMNHSFQRLVELLETLTVQGFLWTTDKNIMFLEKSLQSYTDFYTQLKRTKILDVQTIKDFCKEKDIVAEQITLFIQSNIIEQ